MSYQFITQQNQNNLTFFPPKPNASPPANPVSGNCRHPCLSSCSSHQLEYHYSLALTTTSSQSPSAINSTSWVSIKSILFPAPLLPLSWLRHLISLLNDWSSLLTHLSVHWLSLILHGSQGDLSKPQILPHHFPSQHSLRLSRCSWDQDQTLNHDLLV